MHAHHIPSYLHICISAYLLAHLPAYLPTYVRMYIHVLMHYEHIGPFPGTQRVQSLYLCIHLHAVPTGSSITSAFLRVHLSIYICLPVGMPACADACIYVHTYKGMCALVRICE